LHSSKLLLRSHYHFEVRRKKAASASNSTVSPASVQLAPGTARRDDEVENNDAILNVLFWAFFASYIVHILDETLLNGGFVQWVVQNFWPQYRARMFFWFNAGAVGAIVASSVLFDSLGGHWVILPIMWFAGFVTHAFTFQSVLGDSTEHLLARSGHESAVRHHLLSADQIWRRRPLRRYGRRRHRHNRRRRDDRRVFDRRADNSLSAARRGPRHHTQSRLVTSGTPMAAPVGLKWFSSTKGFLLIFSLSVSANNDLARKRS
jgi:hypothetical protein